MEAELVEGIKLRDLLSGSATFKIDLNKDIEADEEDFNKELFIDNEPQAKESPWLKSFDELKQEMVKMPLPIAKGSIFKRIINEGVGEPMGYKPCRFRWIFSMFYEHEKSSFDSSYYDDAKIVQTSISNELFIGIYLSVASMRRNEEAQFVIDYRLMYTENGIKSDDNEFIRRASANILVVAQMVDFKEIGDENACDGLSEADSYKFPIVKERVVEVMKGATQLKENKQYRNIIKTSHKALERLQFCLINDEMERAQQKQLFIDVYIQLAECYNKIEDWSKAIAMVKELRMLTDVDSNVDILVIEAIAHSEKDCDYSKSLELLRKAQKIDPHHTMVNKILRKTLKADANYKNQTKMVYKNMFGGASTPVNRTEKKSVNDSEVDQLIKSICEMEIGSGVPLIGYSQEQLEKIENNLENNLKFKLQKNPDSTGHISYTIIKRSI